MGAQKLGRPMFRVPVLGVACGAQSQKRQQGHEDSEYVLSFEIGQRESGFYSERTDRGPSSTVLVYRYEVF